MSRGAPAPRNWGELHGDVYPGDGVAPVVFVHGVMDRAGSFRRTARRITNGELVAYDRRGYARSAGAPVTDSMSQQVDDLAMVLASLERPALVVGHSQGALIALHALTSPAVAPLIAGAIVWEPPMPWEDWYHVSTGTAAMSHGVDGSAEFFLRQVIGDRRWERLNDASRAARRADGAALIADLSSSRADAGRVDLAGVRGPVVAGCGSATSAHGRRSAETVAALVPDARLEIIEGSGHAVHLSHPAEFASLIESERSTVVHR